MVASRQRGKPVSIPLPMQGEEEEIGSDQFAPKVGAFSREDTSRMLRLIKSTTLIFLFSFSFHRFIDTAPWPMRNALLNEGRSKREVEEEVNCTWTIQVGKTRNKKRQKEKGKRCCTCQKHKHQYKAIQLKKHPPISIYSD